MSGGGPRTAAPQNYLMADPAALPARWPSYQRRSGKPGESPPLAKIDAGGDSYTEPPKARKMNG